MTNQALNPNDQCDAMNFAVIEYSSKTGKVWRHTPERPNYLADPQKEIDPTSFGCYVSAMQGRHIPLTQLVGSRKFGNRLYRKVVGHWPRKYSLKSLADLAVAMVVHDIAHGPEMTIFTQTLRQKLPSAIILGVPTQPFGVLQDYWQRHSDWLADFQQFMESCDVFITVVQSTVPVWQSMTKARVEYLPQPYPVNYAQRYWQPLNMKKKVILVAGVTERNNIKKGLAVAKKVQRLLPEYLIQVTRTPDSANELSALEGGRFEIMDFLPWKEQLDYLGRVKVVINTDYTQTRGRVQTDCAAVGTVSIGADSDGQRDLFPNYYSSAPLSTEALVEQTVGLLREDELYDRTVKTARARLAEYDYEKSAQRLTNLVQTIR